MSLKNKNVSVTVNDNIQLVCIILAVSLHILFFYHFILSFLVKKFSLWNQSFRSLATIAFELETVCVLKKIFLEL